MTKYIVSKMKISSNDLIKGEGVGRTLPYFGLIEIHLKKIEGVFCEEKSKYAI